MTQPNPASLEPVAKAICSQHQYQFNAACGSGSYKQAFHIVAADGQDLALKVLQQPISSPRTNREINAMLRCQHPNIARIIKIGKYEFQGNTHDFIIEQYLSGGTLTDRLRQNPAGLLNQADTLSLGSMMIDALNHLANLKLIHRDIKPDNIMYGSNDVPILVDFGLVRDLTASSITETWQPRGPGSPYFASPEQLNNEKALYSWRTDQFTLGVVLSLVRFGIHPYQDRVGDPYSTVERVSHRGVRSQDFIQLASNAQLSCLIRMTEAWTASRFRKPQDLIRAWQQQGS